MHDQAVAALLYPRTAMSLMAANREVDGLIRDGVPVEYEAVTGPDAGKKVTERLKVIDFDAPAAQAGCNEYLAVTQLWVHGETGLPPSRRAAVRQRPAAGVHRAEELAT